MSNNATDLPALVEYGVATLPFPGETESGDQYVVRSFENGTLIAVADGLGHGPKAAIAAKAAVALLETYARESVVPLLKRCHKELVKTRGAAVSLASINVSSTATMTWAGVGNVTGLFWHADPNVDRAHERLLLRGGVVGYRLPPLRIVTIPIVPGDTLILGTDGLHSSFSEALTMEASPQQIADRIHAEYRRGTDDSLVLVARYVGRPI